MWSGTRGDGRGSRMKPRSTTRCMIVKNYVDAPRPSYSIAPLCQYDVLHLFLRDQ